MTDITRLYGRLESYLRIRTDVISHLYDEDWVDGMGPSFGTTPGPSGITDYGAWKEENLPSMMSAVDGMRGHEAAIDLIPGGYDAVKRRTEFGSAERRGRKGFPSSEARAKESKRIARGWMREILQRQNAVLDGIRGNQGHGGISSIGLPSAPTELQLASAQERLYDMIGTTSGARQAARSIRPAADYTDWLDGIAAEAARLHAKAARSADVLYAAPSIKELGSMVARGALHSDGPYVGISSNPLHQLASCNCRLPTTPQILVSFTREDVEHLAGIPEYDVLETCDPATFDAPQPVERLFMEESRVRNGAIKDGHPGMHIYAMWKLPDMDESAHDFAETYGAVCGVTQFVPSGR